MVDLLMLPRPDESLQNGADFQRKNLSKSAFARQLQELFIDRLKDTGAKHIFV